MTVADLKVFVETRTLAKGILDHVPTNIVEELAPALAEHRELIANDPRSKVTLAAGGFGKIAWVPRAQLSNCESAIARRFLRNGRLQ